ncbi:MAG: Rid family hydrolase [Pseudomonadota bacterium]|jgi:2-iminobutanoate/2-iminopropanoate deaminase
MGWVAGVSIRTRMLSMALLAVMTIAPAWAAPLFLDAGSSLPGDMPFSAAVRQGAVLYLSGQLGVLPGTRTLPPGGIRVEARQAILNSESVRKANGRGLHDVIRCTVMLAAIAEWPAFNAVWVSMLDKPYPARSALGTTGLALGGRVEIDCLAAAGP